MKPQGMIWFNILRVVVPLGAIWSLFSPYSAIQGLSLFKDGSASTCFTQNRCTAAPTLSAASYRPLWALV